MEQPSVVSSATGSGVLFEFPHATIQDSPSMEQFLQFLDKPTVQKRDTTGQINFVTSFLMNGTASINQKYFEIGMLMLIVVFLLKSSLRRPPRR